MIKTFQDLFWRLDKKGYNSYLLYAEYVTYRDICAHMCAWIQGEAEMDYNHKAELLWRGLRGVLTGLQTVGFIEEEEEDALADELQRMFEEGCDA